jgi:insertion element IS1 protein InsB
MWSFVVRKSNPRWLWHAIDHHTGAVLEPFGITHYYSDGWGAYARHLGPDQHTVGKDNTQKIESKHINLRTRIKRLVRRTICFSKSEQMHDRVIGLFINRYEFGRLL